MAVVDVMTSAAEEARVPFGMNDPIISTNDVPVDLFLNRFYDCYWASQKCHRVGI